ncbi:hypothetical protein PENSPDRAFT_695665 [Peniophora sp. CONT]|nr:hypothetical protein PENSPDRAFT_695665 [Peniophora sp. CONT]
MSPQTTSTSSTRPSDDDTGQSDFDTLWNEALWDYKKETGKELLKHPFAKELLSRPTADEVIQYIANQNETFEGFRASGRKILDVVKPIVHVVQLFIDVGAEGASQVTPGGKAIFVAIGALLQAAEGITALYNAIESLLRKVNASLARIRVYLEPSSPPNPALFDVLRLTLVQVFVVLGIVTKYCDKAGVHMRT